MAKFSVDALNAHLISPMSKPFDAAEFSSEKVADRIRETRNHLRDELLPAARGHPQSVFLVPFVEFLDRQAERFEASLLGPIDLLALACRNLLEFHSLLNQVFTNEQTRAEFVGEMYLDSEEIRSRVERMGVPPQLLQKDAPEWESIPSRRILVMKDKFDDYFFKLCSKHIHPSAVSILCPDALPGPFVFYFFGSNYLGRSYNFLVDRVFRYINLTQSPPSPKETA